MTDLTTLPEPKRLLLLRLVDELRLIDGVVAVVLGGSYAAGTAHQASDLDIGLYYSEARPFSIAAIRRVAEGISTEGAPTVTDFYGWGAWVNGGAWILSASGKVDFLYRNLEQVRRTIAEASLGTVHHDYCQQPTYGFTSLIYLAETHYCLPVYDPQGVIATLKRLVAVYPPVLKQKVVASSLWLAEFTLLHAHDFAAWGDTYNTVGCLTRVVSFLTQALFALNERYFPGDKRVTETLARFGRIPLDYVSRVHRVLACPGGTVPDLTRTVEELEGVWRSVAELCADFYTPQLGT
jgi:hypothetical protein